MATTATLSSRFQISIPKAVREQQRWQVGQQFVFIPKGKGVLVLPAPELQQLAGIAKGARKDGYRDRKDRYWSARPIGRRDEEAAAARHHGRASPSGGPDRTGRPAAADPPLIGLATWQSYDNGNRKAGVPNVRTDHHVQQGPGHDPT